MTDRKHHKLWLLSPGLNFKQVVVAQLREHDILILILLAFWCLSSQVWLWDSLPYSSVFEVGLHQIRAKKPRADCLVADGSGRRSMKGALGMQDGVCQFCLLLALQPFFGWGDKWQTPECSPGAQWDIHSPLSCSAPFPQLLCAPTYNLRCTQLLKTFNSCWRVNLRQYGKTPNRLLALLSAGWPPSWSCFEQEVGLDTFWGSF